MKLENGIKYFLVTLFLISPITILGEKVPKYANLDSVGTFGANNQRKLEEKEHYISVKYKALTIYESFENEYRQNISHIINGNTQVEPDKPLEIKANAIIKIVFNTTITNLTKFFYDYYDPNVEFISSIDLSNFDSSLLESLDSTFI